MLLAYEDKSAYALCVFSLALRPNEPVCIWINTFYCVQRLFFMFIHAGLTNALTFQAEMPKEENHNISHRARALALDKDHIAETRYNFKTETSS